MKDKRTALLESGLRLFVENGFHATPTSQIAREAGVATGTLFHYFKTKEDLINSIYIENKDLLIKALKMDLEEQMTVKSKLRKLFFNFVYWALDYTCELQFFNQFSNSPFIDQLTKEQGMERFSFVFEIVKNGQETDVLKDLPADLLFDVAQGVLNGFVLNLLANRDRVNDLNFLENGFSLYWDCIKG
ncbi:MAG: TetR/AcrR family transcriptional regulator [Bacteroidota bacterium]|nr:TetR/AcrR family transcriptional regulator [Bacteroidota bacterium]